MLALVGVWLAAGPARAQLEDAYGIAGGVYENFNGMGSSGTIAPGASSTTSYWSVRSSNTDKTKSLRPSPTALGATPNWGYNGGPWDGSGLSPVTDRALGVYKSAIGDMAVISARFLNNTGESLTQITVRYDMEVWLQTTANRSAGFYVEYSPDNAVWHDMGTAFESYKSGLSLPSVTDGWVNGNAPAASVRNVGGAYTLPAPLVSGDDFYLRWRAYVAVPGDLQDTGSFIDNLVVVPEPAAVAGLILAGAVLLRRRWAA